MLESGSTRAILSGNELYVHPGDFERFYLDRSCVLHFDQAHLLSFKTRASLPLGRARHSLVTPFPTERLAFGSTRMVVVKLLLLRYHPR